MVLHKVHRQHQEVLPLPRRHLAAVLAGAAALLAAAGAQASMIIATGGSSLKVTSVPAPGNAGYVFYAAGINEGNSVTSFEGIHTGSSGAAPTNWVSIDTFGDSFYGSTGYTMLTINGTNTNTGLAYQHFASGGATDIILATLTFGSGVPGSLDLGVLEDNGSGANNTMASVTLADSADNTITATANVAGTQSSNDFYFFDLSGLSPGDAITVAVTNKTPNTAGANAELGGFTFDTVPESSTLGLLAVSSLGLLMIGRRRRMKD